MKATTTRAEATEGRRGAPPSLFRFLSLSYCNTTNSYCACANERWHILGTSGRVKKVENSKGFFRKKKSKLLHFSSFFPINRVSLSAQCLRADAAPGLFLRPIAIAVAEEDAVGVPSGSMAGGMSAAEAAGAGSEVEVEVSIEIETEKTGGDGDPLLLAELSRTPPPQRQRQQQPRRPAVQRPRKAS